MGFHHRPKYCCVLIQLFTLIMLLTLMLIPHFAVGMLTFLCLRIFQVKKFCLLNFIAYSTL